MWRWTVASVLSQETIVTEPLHVAHASPEGLYRFVGFNSSRRLGFFLVGDCSLRLLRVASSPQAFENICGMLIWPIATNNKRCNQHSGNSEIMQRANRCGWM